MHLIVDESTGPSVARWLEDLGHDVVSIYDDAPRLPDDDFFAFAIRDDCIVITNDTVDFVSVDPAIDPRECPAGSIVMPRSRGISCSVLRNARSLDCARKLASLGMTRGVGKLDSLPRKWTSVAFTNASIFIVRGTAKRHDFLGMTRGVGKLAPPGMIAAQERFLVDSPDERAACFVVVTEHRIRVTREDG
jgi:predicted nuclease of predicted toxin-antitoxin system